MLSYLKGHYISELMDQTVDGETVVRPQTNAMVSQSYNLHKSLYSNR